MSQIAMDTEIKAGTKNTQEYFLRFNISQRMEHIVLMVTFTVLAITGLAEKYYTAAWADWLIFRMGGIQNVYLVHRAFGVVFVLSVIYHLGFLIYYLGIRKGRPAMLPGIKDARDVVASLRYSLGLRKKHVLFGRYDYRQKFEYLGILFGSAIMILTGLMLAFPIQFTSILPGQFVAAALEAHGNEALLAVIVIVIWHLYDVIFKPGIFPGDFSIFTGKIPRKRMMEEHALEYAEIAEIEVPEVEKH